MSLNQISISFPFLLLLSISGLACGDLPIVDPVVDFDASAEEGGSSGYMGGDDIAADTGARVTDFGDGGVDITYLDQANKIYRREFLHKRSDVIMGTWSAQL